MSGVEPRLLNVVTAFLRTKLARMSRRFRVRKRPSDHTLQLFDSDESRAEVVSDFIVRGLTAGETVLAIVTGTTWSDLAGKLVRADIRIHEAIASGQLKVLDAASALSDLLIAGSPDASRFEQTIGTFVRRCHARGGRLRVYGEAVDLLTVERNFVAAQQLEELWNDLLATCPSPVLCGYSTLNFGDPRSIADLRQICRAHSGVRVREGDELGTWLVRRALRPGTPPSVTE